MARQLFLGDDSNEFAKASKTKVKWWFDRWDNWYMAGGGGNDTLIGGILNDTLRGGTGTDILEGGKGDDKYYVDRYTDKVIEDAGEGYDIVYSSSSNYSLSNAKNVERLILEEDINVRGGYGNNDYNAIEGNKHNNVIYGHGEGDVLYGNGGNDKIVGGTGGDHIQGGDGSDTLIGTSGFGDSGYNEWDYLQGGDDADYFVLGHGNTQYYNSNGNKDYAVVADFEANRDVVQLPYDDSSYVVGSTNSSFGSAGLYHVNGNGGDLVAIFQGETVDSVRQAMDTSAFQYDV